MSEFLRLLWGTVIFRPYVYAFFGCFLFFSLRHLGRSRTIIYLIVAYAIAYASEFSATRNGFPFGMYVYLDETRSRELWLSNIPFWDSLSFVFLSYFSWLVAASVRCPKDPNQALYQWPTAILGGFMMMILDVVIDPLTLLGDRWFLGKIYYYPEGGHYFGVTLSNFIGWWFVGTLTLLINQTLLRSSSEKTGVLRPITRREGWGAIGVYTGILGFNLTITVWIKEWALLGASLGVSILAIFPPLLLYRRARE